MDQNNQSSIKKTLLKKVSPIVAWGVVGLEAAVVLVLQLLLFK